MARRCLGGLAISLGVAVVMLVISIVVTETLDSVAGSHAFLLHRHGLYTWGDTLADAERQIEILEFLFEAIGRTGQVGQLSQTGGTSWRS